MATFPPALFKPDLLGGTRTASLVPPGGGAPGGPKTVQNFRSAPVGGGGATLEALMLRQRQAQAAQEQNMSQPQGTILGGIGQVAGSIFNALAERRAEKEQGVAWGEVGQAMRNRDPATGLPTDDAMAVLWQRSPEIASRLEEAAYKARADAASEERWTPIPTPEGENGQWFQNQQGDTKKVGGGSTGEAGWKPSDIDSLRDDYTKAAAQFENSTPAWDSMQRSAQIALNPDAAVEGKGAADYDMIVGWAKLLDPNSVVRDNEVDSASMTGGMISQINGLLNKWKSQGSLDDATRRAIMTQASSRMRGYYDQAKGKHDWIAQIATENKVPVHHVVPPLREFKDWIADDDNVDPAKAATDDEAYPG